VAVRRRRWAVRRDPPGLSRRIVSTVFSTAATGPGAAVLEIGCGTGQFTRQLAGRALDVTAIDIGAAMVAAARRNVADPRARFQVCSSQDFTGLDLVQETFLAMAPATT
jgi:16S rRNA A1518/A1519 N6-dimethyltransferase RsmA/KsgA/DIM1 with predicted DNA glycosylase/AP lyase activity